MAKHILVVILVLSMVFLFNSQPAQGLSLENILKIKNIAMGIFNGLGTLKADTGITQPFGGKITKSGTACKLSYDIDYIPGYPIPLFGTKIDVSRPGIPASDIYTFPGISKIYANHNEDREGVWTLGLTLDDIVIEKILDAINSGLDSFTPICFGYICITDVSLTCPEDGRLIFKIGTS